MLSYELLGYPVMLRMHTVCVLHIFLKSYLARFNIKKSFLILPTQMTRNQNSNMKMSVPMCSIGTPGSLVSTNANILM